jgi:hypothetical protein
MSDANNVRLTGKHGVIIRHRAVLGRRKAGESLDYDERLPVRKWEVCAPKPYGSWTTSVTIQFLRYPRRRQWHDYTAVPDNLSYLTIENAEGITLYDSRRDLPFDMEKFTESRERDLRQWQERDRQRDERERERDALFKWALIE